MDYADHYSGGYFVIIPAERPNWPPPWGPPELFPSRLISASGEIAQRIPGDWDLPYDNISDTDRQEHSATLRLGVGMEALKRIATWVDQKWRSGELGFMTGFRSLAPARELLHTFIPKDSDTVPIGVGLHRSLLDEFLVRCKAPPGSVASAITGEPGEYPLYELISRRQPLEPGGKELGYELLGYHSGDFTSWLVHPTPGELARELNIRPNSAGLLTTFEEAMQGKSYIARTGGVEPGWWAPWLIVRYPMTA
jgi:hypothetical protein